MILEAGRHGCAARGAGHRRRRCPSRTRASGPPTPARRPTPTHARFAEPGSDFLALLNLWDYLGDAAARAVGIGVPPHVQAASSCTTCGSASGRTCTASCGRPPRCRRRCIGRGPRARRPAEPASDRRARPGRAGRPGAHVAAGRPAVPHRACRRPTPKRAAGGAGRPSSRGARGPVRHLPRLRAGQEAAALGGGGRAGGDHPAVGPDGGADRAGVGRAAGRAPGPAAATASRAGTPGAARRWPPRRSRLYGLPIVGRRGGSTTAGSTRRRPGSCSSGTPWSRATGDHHRFFARTTSGCSTRPRSWRSGPGGAASSSTTRRCSTSTTRGSRPTSRPPGTSTRWWKKARAADPDLLTFTLADLVGPAAGRRRARTTIPATWGELPLSYGSRPASRTTG